VNREGPEPIDAVAGRMATVIGRTRRANLDAAWELGACFEGALSGADEHRRSRVAKELRRALADRGCDVGLSTLYAYRHVHRAFARERLPELAEDGLTLSHVTILAALDEPLRAAVWSRLEDDGIPPVRDFRALVADRRREVVLRDAAGVAAPADEAPPARIAEAGAPPPATGGTADDGAAPAPVRPASREARPAGLVITERGDVLRAQKLPLLRDEWQAIVDRATPDARIIWRSGGLDVDFVDPLRVKLNKEEARVGELLTYNRELAGELHEQDRVHTYGSFYIADLATA